MSEAPRLGTSTSGWLFFRCAGCRTTHVVDPKIHGFNGDHVRPTFTPSILVQGHAEHGRVHCHSYVTDGRIQFLGDSAHALAGQTVDLEPWEAARPFVAMGTPDEAQEQCSSATDPTHHEQERASMGDYVIKIRGTGCHHNTPPIAADADRLGALLAKTLLAHGHVIVSAGFHTGSHPEVVNLLELAENETRSPGQVAFEAYNAHRGGKSHDGRDTPPWSELGDGVRAGWEAAAAALGGAFAAFAIAPPRIEAPPTRGCIHLDVLEDGRVGVLIQAAGEANAFATTLDEVVGAALIDDVELRIGEVYTGSAEVVPAVPPSGE